MAVTGMVRSGECGLPGDAPKGVLGLGQPAPEQLRHTYMVWQALSRSEEPQAAEFTRRGGQGGPGNTARTAGLGCFASLGHSLPICS